MTGVIVELRAGGFGFLRSDESGEKRRIFFHAKELCNTAFSDDILQRKCSFTLEQSDRGPRAVGVELI
jgi:cold shock CspA family protein